MNVASLELCKELYELSGWRPEFKRIPQWIASEGKWYLDTMGYRRGIPAYDLGYLLRKLPDSTEIKKLKYDLKDLENNVANIRSNNWGYVAINQKRVRADTPENALCQLAIELFKRGVIN